MISQKAKYALQALSFLAEKYQEKMPVHIQAIADEKKIPLKFLEAILLELRKADILVSIRGRSGGYMLKENPKKTKLATVLRISDGPIALVSCVSLNFYKPCDNCNVETCCIKNVMIEARDAILKILEKRTLKDLINADSI
jgi:Rrf2 family protein